ncbi:sulfurtransferase [Acinetobacter gyllenbergii]|jgi:rhodanese-related sulfurtransferase|uniref:Rhodanese domain-containing protein n=1 Tax=Acinetobacter gyllenbergii CIP 110306 = MTCC 11365 TaxID=1217657 RepID=A0A829HMW1_9GAMM|nr:MULTISPECIES: rhodanese-like domain-containing protein [Acinetobacter]EPF90596.1 hypothetical protein F957_00951 [Acinetobacter gyllenbergii CIP 110306 = MTCC 11365]MCU4377173.1 rhodanese-like domain-containing protein [Acinetobacter haemolyticus]MEB3792758.1 rhodanese-like domain-containing protein [Acinetobacter sp. IK40]NNP69013.1 sulfurtransferase [Acinetobacter sp. Ac_5812]WEI18441.1 rhodanese-like domain-containing protein [Acinetobacter proteolyticus]
MKTADQLILDAKQHIQEISVKDFHKIWTTNNDLILIDVREPEEYQEASIDRSVNFPRGLLEMKIAQHPLVNHHCDEDISLKELSQKDIYIICKTGGRSALATLSLQKMGFTKLFSVQGGIQTWLNENLPIN